MNLTTPLPTHVTYNKKKIRVNYSFDCVMAAYHIIADSRLMAPTKVFQALKCFGVKGCYSLTARAEILNLIFDTIDGLTTWIDNYNFPAGNGAAVIDYIKDTSLIFTAFYTSYGIDLFNEAGKLHWAKFIMLLNHIPDTTKLSQVIGYRKVKIPASNKHNANEIRHILEMKSIYGLGVSDEKRDEMINSALSGIFAALATGN